MIKATHNHNWRLVIILGISTLLSLSGDLTLYAILPVNAGGLLLTLAQIGILLSANRFVRLLSNPLAGHLLDRGKRRPIYLSGLLLGTFSSLVYTQTRVFWILLIGRLMWGFAWSFINVGGTTMVIDSTQQGNRGRFLGILNLLLSLGLALNPLLGGFLADAVGFRPTMLVCALLTGAGFLLALFLLPETRPATPGSTPPEEFHTEDQLLTSQRQPDWLSSLKDFKVESFSREIWLVIFLTGVIFFAGNGLIMATIGRFLALEFGDGLIIGGALIGISALTGIALSTRSMLMASTSPLAGAFSDRGKSRWPAVFLGLCLGTLGMLALGKLEAMPALVTGIILISICEGVLFTVLPAIIGDKALESQRGLAMGLTFVAADLGAALAPLLVYSLIAWIPLRSVYSSSAGMLGISLVLVLVHWAKRLNQP